MTNARNSPTTRSVTESVYVAARSRLIRAIRELNLFSDHPLWSSALTHAEQILNTRLFFFVLVISILTIIAYTSLRIRTHDITLENFSLDDFERLEAHHPHTLSAPCTQLSIPYNTFVNLSSEFHPICSSFFISDKWISSLFLPNATTHHLLDLRTFTFAQFRALALLCRTARRAVKNAQHTFASTHLVAHRAFSRAEFIRIMDVVFNNFKRNTIVNEKRIAALTSLSIVENRVISALRTNYYIQSKPGTRSYLAINGVYARQSMTNKSNCFCRPEGNRCVSPAGIFDKWMPPETLNATQSIAMPRMQIPGLMAGCLPLESMRQSTLECLYNQSCINILNFQLQRPRPKALKTSGSRFPINATIESMFDESLFLESWQSKPNYEAYFAACAPRTLSYSYVGPVSLATIFTVCVSAFGGLVIAWQLIMPAIIKLWKRIVWSRRRRKHAATPNSPTSIEEAILSVAPRPLNQAVIAHAHRTIFTFNLFSQDDDNDPEDERAEIIATRLYILFLLIGLIILGCYTFITTHTNTYNFDSPSMDDFEELHLQHASGLECQCTHMSISHGRMLTIIPRYHEICTSEFLQDYWLSYFGAVQLDAFELSFLTNDFRVSGQSFFELLKIFCKTTNETIQNALDVFYSNRFFTANAISREEFNVRMTDRMKQFEHQIISSFLNLVDLVHSSIKTNRLVTEMFTSDAPVSSFDNQTSTWSLRFRPRRYYSNSCSCALSNRCTRPIGFYYQSDKVNSSPNITVPGLVLGCYPVDSFLLSTLECFYDRKCLKLIVDMYDFDVIGLVLPLDKRAMNVSSLNSENSRFHPNSTIEEIFSQLFIEEWITSHNYTDYFARCAPKQCTYNVMQRFDMPYMITMMLGFGGGLSVVLEVILPPIVKLLRRWLRKRERRQERDGDTTINTAVNFNNRDYQRVFLTVNFFETEISATNKRFEYEEIIATRIYIFLFVLCLIAAFLYAGPFTDEIKTTTIAYPTSDIVNDLHSRQLLTLSCPCSTAAINYSTFLQITPHYYQICSSEFVSSAYWTFLFEKEDNISLALSAHYRLLASLCDVARRTIDNKKELFETRELINVEAITRSSFETQIDALVSTFITQIPADFRRILSFTIGSFRVNQLLNAFTTNWHVDFATENEYYMINTRPRRFSSSNCTCATSSNCIEQLTENTYTGCFPFDGLRLSTYENLSMNYLTQKLFVETWQNESNYTTYFETCRPLECQYTLPDRSNFLYILTTVLGLYGGLRYILRLIIGQSLLAYRWWMKHIRRQQIDVVASNAVTL
ncbi:unnamed protein product [Adineta ricciae]|uniref:Uncharacterized protein n=1 Tax=Adineta ricciae TaxID=249248 RepID=A0A813YEQ3_ADIRI|nr:unnamed protein product [Adineta ricciae]CAF1348836.1 unnamed protein product [Adineta ricciae]